MLRSALSAKLQNLRLKGITKHSVWDRLIFSKAKKAMGMKNVRLMISGGAPLPTQTMEVRTKILIFHFSIFHFAILHFFIR
jgi:long-subunit acyl-CoA synthetase (AMP-forming)